MANLIADGTTSFDMFGFDIARFPRSSFNVVFLIAGMDSIQNPQLK